MRKPINHPARWPAAMPVGRAAEYCDLSPDTFLQRCSVKPISLGNSPRGDRWLRVRLDEWLIALGETLGPVIDGKMLEAALDEEEAGAQAGVL